MTAQLSIDPYASIAPAPGRVAIALAVSCLGSALSIQVSEADADRLQGTGQTWPWTRTDTPYEAVLVEQNGSDVMREVTFSSQLTFPRVQTFSDGRFLLAGSRCQRFPDGTAECNAWIYGADGSCLSQITLGDGLQHVRVDTSNRIWVGYFDEGVFGNFGWDQPIGRSGIVRFSASGGIDWEYHGGPFIDDCYALNVASEQAWTCFYSGFPIVKIDSSHVTVWENDVAGARALAVDHSRVLLVGGYKQNASRTTLVRLGDDGRTELLEEYEIVLSTEASLTDAQVHGVGDTVHLLTTDGSWFRLKLGDL